MSSYTMHCITRGLDMACRSSWSGRQMKKTSGIDYLLAFIYICCTTSKFILKIMKRNKCLH